jgi:hypothetical protein
MRVLDRVCLVSGSVLVLVGCASHGQQASAAPPPAPVRFGGSWVLNRQDSELSPRTSGGRESGYGGGRFGGGEGGERGGFGGGFGGGRGGRGGGWGGSEAQEGGQDAQGAAVRGALRPAEHLVLDLTDSTVTITAGDEGAQLLPTDGRKVEDVTGDDRRIETRARWKDGSLRIERSLSGAFKVTDVYTLSWTGNRLEDVRVVERSDRPGATTKLRLIYDRQAADST